MKVVRFLLGFICGLWSFISCAIGFVIGLTIEQALYGDRCYRYRSPDYRLHYSDFKQKSS